MRIYVGFDDTDVLDADRGTGKLVRWFESELPEGCSLWGVVRQQLLVDDAIPYTSHNSAACAVVEAPDASILSELIDRAAAHLERHSLLGSDPGLCAAHEEDPNLPRLIDFGRRASTEVVTQREALEAAEGTHLSGHGGTDDGIIGAAACVGLTAHGWGGRLIEYGRLRDFPPRVRASELERAGILVVSVDRDGPAVGWSEEVDSRGWLRPRLWGGKAVLPVSRANGGPWTCLGSKRRGRKAAEREGSDG